MLEGWERTQRGGGWEAGQLPHRPAFQICRGEHGPDHMTGESHHSWVDVRLVATSPAGPTVKILTYFPPAATGPGKLLRKGLAPHQDTLSLPMIVRKGRSYGQNG